MLKIKTNKGYLDLGGDFTVQIDEKSPVMNDRGSQTVPVTVPVTANNAVITGFAHRLDMGVKPMNEDQTCTVLDGVYKRTGKINIVSAGKKEGITLNIGFDNSEAYSEWKEKKLGKLTLPKLECDSAASLMLNIRTAMNGSFGADFDIFQIVVQNDSKDGTYYPQYINHINIDSDGGYSLCYQDRTETLLINDTPTETTLPYGYGVAPFLYVHRVLEYVFSEFGYTIVENPFKTDKELSCLVILNNAADCCVTGTLDYADLMPDCTVEEFLNALYVRFGLVYNVSSDTKTVTLRLIRDIIEAEPTVDLSLNLAAEPLINYETARQIKLSAKTSFTNAAPSVERYEDYIKGNEKMVIRVSRFDPSKAAVWLNYEKTTGNWYKWDSVNKKHTLSSSSFFNWDRKTENAEDEELASDDECVFMDFAPNGLLSPYYLAGCVHRHTYLKTSSGDEEDSEEEDTPLSFAFAFTERTAEGLEYPFGSVLPYAPDGGEITLKDGGKHTISLLFQFEDGLFAKFWQKYDAVLRHSFNQVETNTLLPVHQLMKMDVLTPVALRGQYMLLDGLSYSLPAGKLVPVDITLRSLRLIGPYDLDSEQGIPMWADASYVWIVYSSSLQGVQNERVEYWEDYYRYHWGYAVYGCRVSDTIYDGYVTPSTDEDILKNPPTAQDNIIEKTYKCKIEVEIEVNERSGAANYFCYETEEVEYQVRFVASRVLN